MRDEYGEEMDEPGREKAQLQLEETTKQMTEHITQEYKVDGIFCEGDRPHGIRHIAQQYRYTAAYETAEPARQYPKALRWLVLKKKRKPNTLATE